MWLLIEANFSLFRPIYGHYTHPKIHSSSSQVRRDIKPILRIVEINYYKDFSRWLLWALGVKAKKKLKPAKRMRKKKNMMNIRWNPMENYQEQNALVPNTALVKLEKKIGYNFKKLEYKHQAVMDDIRERSEEVLNTIASRSHQPIYHKTPPYHTPQHYSAPAPPAYKAVYEVDFTPIFLTLLPVFLVLGTLLGLLLSGLNLSSTTTTNSTTPSVSVNVNSSSSSTSSVTSTGSNATNSVLPVFIFSNGTLAVPLLSFTGFNNFFNLFGLSGIVIGRSFTSPFPFLLLFFYLVAGILLALPLTVSENIDNLSDLIVLEDADEPNWEVIE